MWYKIAKLRPLNNDELAAIHFYEMLGFNQDGSEKKLPAMTKEEKDRWHEAEYDHMPA